jgi:hypothetical protein
LKVFEHEGMQGLHPMAQQDFQVDRTTALYERPAMGIVDPSTFNTVKQAIERAFAAASVESFLKSLDRDNIRIRNFEAVLHGGKLGAGTEAEYGKLGNGDQGQIREFYLASLEKVELGLRDRFFKLYAYY